LAPIDWLTAAARELQSGKMPDRIASVKDSEFRALIDAFNAAIEAIARTEKVRKQLIADIAHELRTPVTNIKGQLEAHEAGLISEDAEFVTTLKGENRLLERLVEDFQQLAISDAGQLKVNLQSMPLAEIVRNILEPMAEAANATVVVAVPEMLHVFIDEERFRQVLLNLWENAVRHQPDKLTVTVTAEGPDPYWATLVFQDNGPGIAAEDRPYVFERFFRAEKSRNRALGGAGLGLTIVKGLLEAMGGRIELADRDGGAAFAVTLVRVDPDDAERN
jgi:signal transduction histidine kinase